MVIYALLPEGMNLGGGLSGIGSALSALKNILIGLAVGVIVLATTGFIVWKRKQNKSYNIPLIIITPRSDGRVVEINTGVGGFFKSKKVGGITSFRVKRKGLGMTEIPPPASSFLSSPNRTLILAQKGIDDYEPVMPDSLTTVETPEGISIPILKMRAINQDATAWAFDNEETAKKRFTFMGVWEKYGTLISMMLFMFVIGLALYINWMGLKDVVAGLTEVAQSLRQTSAPIITSG